MKAASTAFPTVENGYSPRHVDEFVARLAQRARAQISGLEERVTALETQLAQPSPMSDAAVIRIADLQRQLDQERRQPSDLERRIAETEALLAEERIRASALEMRLGELDRRAAYVETLENDGGEDEVVEFDAIEAVPELQTDKPEPTHRAHAAIGRPTYGEWSQEQRERVLLALRRKRSSACTPPD